MKELLLILALLSANNMTKIFIQDTRVVGMDSGYSAMYSDLLANTIRKQNKFEIVTSKDIAELVDYENQKDTLGCNDVYCLADLGGVMIADLMLTSSINKFPDSYVLTITLSDVSQMKVITGVDMTINDLSTDKLNKTIKEKCNEIIDIYLHPEKAAALAKKEQEAQKAAARTNTKKEVIQTDVKGKEKEKAKDKQVNIVNITSPFTGLNVGDTIKYGVYEQDGDSKNGAEPIEWIVLAVYEAKALLISKTGLDVYDFQPATWNKLHDLTACRRTLTTWVEDTFRNLAFNKDEDFFVKKTCLMNNSDMQQFVHNPEDRLCRPSPFAKAKGAKVNEAGNSPWWLEDNAKLFSNAQFSVDENGKIISTLNLDEDRNIVIRPAMWVRTIDRQQKEVVKKK